MKKILTLALVAVLSASLSACVGATPEPRPNPSPSQATSLDDSAGTLEDPASPGTEIEVTTVAEAHYAVAIGDAEFDATKAVTGNSSNPSPDSGFQYLVVPVTYENLGDTVFGVGLESALLMFVDNQNNPYAGAVVAVEDSAFDAPPVESGDSVTVNLVYEVPVGTTSGTWTIGGEFYVIAS